MCCFSVGYYTSLCFGGGGEHASPNIGVGNRSFKLRYESKLSPRNESLEQLRDSRIALLGFGKENRALGRFLCAQGFDFSVCDGGKLDVIQNRAEWNPCVHTWRIGPRYLEALIDFDWIFRTPGINTLRPEIEAARNAGVCVSSQTQLFLDLCPAAVVGITGTKGKGTTAALLADILHKEGDGTTHLGGNIGVPPIRFLEQVEPGDRIVLELSSFQLHDLRSSPQTAVVLGITQDHLDYHADAEEYVNAKGSICRFQGPKDRVIADLESSSARRLVESSPAEKVWFSTSREVPTGTWVEGESLFVHREGENVELCGLHDLSLRGAHNLKNSLAAAATASILGASVESIADSLRSFSGLPHRLQQIGTRNGIVYVDDSAATTPEAAAAAVRCFTEPLQLIAGGSGKGSDFAALGEAVAASNVKAVLLMGDEAESIVRALKDSAVRSDLILERGDSMEWAVAAAERHARPGDVILLSPGCASFGLFANYEDRAQQFKRCARFQ